MVGELGRCFEGMSYVGSLRESKSRTDVQRTGFTTLQFLCTATEIRMVLIHEHLHQKLPTKQNKHHQTIIPHSSALP